MDDIFFTIEKEGKGLYKEKMSKFLSFALPVLTAEEARNHIKEFQNKYHDSRHVCWAYMINPERNEWQLNDNGEPSGTAGKPILGQINSFNITNVLIIVVRYFGGIKLGTPGLIAAYREAARLAIMDAGIKEVFETQTLRISFPYVSANDVMKVVKSEEIEIIERSFDNSCEMKLSFRKKNSELIKGRLEKVPGISFIV